MKWNSVLHFYSKGTATSCLNPSTAWQTKCEPLCLIERQISEIHFLAWPQGIKPHIPKQRCKRTGWRGKKLRIQRDQPGFSKKQQTWRKNCQGTKLLWAFCHPHRLHGLLIRAWNTGFYSRPSLLNTISCDHKKQCSYLTSSSRKSATGPRSQGGSESTVQSISCAYQSTVL